MSTSKTVDVIRKPLSLIQFDPVGIEQVYVPLEANDVFVGEIRFLAQ